MRLDYSTDGGYAFSTSTSKIELSTSVSPGQAVALTVTGLTGGSTYYFRVWTLDEALNSAGLSNGVSTYAQVDVTPPAAITDVSAAASWRRVALSWTAPGDDGGAGVLAGNVRIRYSVTAPITNESEFDSAPFEVLLATTVSPGQSVLHVVTDLADGTPYYFALRAEDNLGNPGTIVARSTASAVPVNAVPGAFALASPPDGAISASASVTLDWNNAVDADTVLGDSVTYTLEYSTDASFTLAVTTFSGLAVSSQAVTLSALLENLTTYWRVRAKDGDGAETSATPASFKLYLNQDNTAPTAFNLVSPADAGNVPTKQPLLDWEDAVDIDPGDVVTYRVDYTTVPGFGTYASSASLPASQLVVPAPLLEDSTYYWRAYATDGVTPVLCNQGSYSFQVDATSSPPASFGLISPAQGVRSTTTTVTFSWQPTTDPDPKDSVSYNLVYSILQNFGSSTTVSGLALTSHTVTFSDNSPVYWFVEAQDSGGNKRTSSESLRYLTIDTAKEIPLPFELLFPTGSVIVDTLKPFLQWASAVDPDPLEQVRYSLDLSDRADFVGAQGIPLTDNFYQVTNNLLDDTTYYWRVRAGGYRGVPPVLQDAEERQSDVGVFVVKVVNSNPQNFALLSPANGSVVSTTRPVFRWQAAMDVDFNDIVRYTLVISSVADFSTSSAYVDISTPVFEMSAPLLEKRNYYWKVVAKDKEGAETVCGETFRFFLPDLTRPRPPLGLKGTWSAPKTAYIVQWNAVTANTDGSAVSDLKGYRVYRSLFAETLGDSTFVAELPVTTLSYEDAAVNGGDFFYAVRAVDDSGIESANSLLVESRSTPMFVALSDDREVQVHIESLRYQGGASGTTVSEDAVVVQLNRRSAEEVGSVLRSYELEIKEATSDQKIDRFRFQKPVEVAFSVNPPAAAAPSPSISGRPVIATAPSLPAEQMSIFWYNGVEYVKLGGYYDSDKKTISVMSQWPGVYRLQQAFQATSFEVVQLWPRKVFTPNGDGINDEMNFVYSNPKLVPVSGKIFDLYGAHVADLQAGRDNSSLIWDGRDSDGHFVAKGVYCYQITSDGKTLNGTIVVAR